MGWEINDIMGELAKVLGGGTAGVFGGMWAGVETWTTCQSWGDGWAIMADDSLVAVLGEPIVLPVIEE